MSFLNPVNWASSIILAKVLSPYFKNLDEKNINIGFWKGDLVLKKLEFNKEFLVFNNSAIDIEGSIIDEIKLTIPWKSIKTDPIKLQVSGVKICLSQEITAQKYSDMKKGAFDDLKKQALKDFDMMVKGRIKSNEDEEGGFFTSLINNIGQNITIEFSKIELVYMFHISHKEIVKFGVILDLISLSPFQKSSFSNSASKEIHLRKELKVEGFALYFDVYDETFINKTKEAEDQSNLQVSSLHNYILNDLNFLVDAELKLGKANDIKANVKISQILFHFNQKQIKYLNIFNEKFAEMQSSRPKYRPTDKRSVVLWWRYALRLVLEHENIKSRVYNTSIHTLINEEKYKGAYIKKILEEKTLSKNDLKFIEKFENNFDLINILRVRNLALDQLRLMSFKFSKGDDNEKRKAEKFFKEYDVSFSNQKASEINLHANKSSDKETHLKLNLNLESINLIIRENDIVDSLKNLQNHVGFFKNALGNQDQLKVKVIEHIKINFIKGLNAGINLNKMENDEEHLSKYDKDSLYFGNFDRRRKLNNFLDFITEKTEVGDNSHRFLLCLKVQGANIDYRLEKNTQKMNLTIQSIVGMDLLGVNNQIQNFLDIGQDIKIYYSSSTIRLMNLRGVNYAQGHQNLYQIQVDLDIPKINAFVHKPFIERVSSLNEFLFFDESSGKQRSTFNDDQGYILYETILRRREQMTMQMNMSITIGKININLPIEYDRSSYMFVLHLNHLKIYQREHQNNGEEKRVIAITTPEAESEYFKSHHFEPLIITLQNLRGLIVKDSDWELTENPFHYDKNFKEKLTNTYITSLFEILQLYISLEKFTQSFTIGEIKRLDVYPTETKVVIKLPIIVFNLTVKNICILQTLATLWTSETSQIKLSQIKNSLQFQRNEAEKAQQQPQEPRVIQGIGAVNAKTKDRLLAKTKLIDHNLTYPPNIVKILTSLVLTQVDLFTQGVTINILCDDEKYFDTPKNIIHRNEIMSIYLHTINFGMKVKYFESFYTITFKHVIIESYERCKQFSVKKYINQIAEDLKHEEKMLNDKSAEPSSASKSHFSNGNVAPKTKCEHCEHAETHLIMNFLNINQKTCDIDIQIRILSKESEKFNKKNLLPTQISIEMAPLTLIADPDAFKQFKLILDRAGEYAAIKYSRFVKFMRDEAFWPEVNIDDHLVGADDIQDAVKKEDKGDALSEIKINLPSLNIIFLNEGKPLYLASLEKIVITFSSFLRDSKMLMNAKSVSFFNTSDIAGNYEHQQILTPNPDEDTLTLEMNLYGNYLAAVKSYSTWVGIRLKGVKIIFLKKVVQEVVEYMRKRLLSSFGSQIESPITDVPVDQRSDMKLELVIQNAIVQAYRNSLDDASLYLNIEKLGVWSTGKWGAEPGDLIDKCVFTFEDKSFDETITGSFEDAVNGVIEEGDTSIIEEPLYPGKIPTKSFKKEEESKNSEDTYKIQLKGVTLNTRITGDAETLFGKMDQNSLDLDVIFEDKSFKPAQKEMPMKLIIKIPSVKLFAYEPEFELLMKIVMENVGECPQTCVSQDLPDHYTDQDIWLVIDIEIKNALLKAFTGARKSVNEKFSKEFGSFDKDPRLLDDFIHKNPQSLALLALKNVTFKMKMRKGGSKIMLLNVKNLDVYDMRYKTKISYVYRKVLNTNVYNSFKFDEETTSYVEAVTFNPENYEDFEDVELEEMINQADSDKQDTEENENDKKNMSKLNKINNPDKGDEKVEVVVDSEIGFNNNNKDENNLILDSSRKRSPQKGILKKPEEKPQPQPTQPQPGPLTRFMDKLRGCCKRKKKDSDDKALEMNQIKLEDGNRIPEVENHYMSMEFNPFEGYGDGVVSPSDKGLNEFIYSSKKKEKTLIKKNASEEFEVEEEIVNLREHARVNPNDVEEDSQLIAEKKRQMLEERNPLLKIPFEIDELHQVKPPLLKDGDNTEKDSDSELFFYMEGGYDSEKNIYIMLNNKSLVVALDLIMGLVDYFKKPFVGCVEPPYMRTMIFNNFPSMRIRIVLNNFSAILLEDFNEKNFQKEEKMNMENDKFQKKSKEKDKNNYETTQKKDALILLANIVYTQEWIGDVGYGPGRGTMGIEVFLKKLFAMSAKEIFGNGPQMKNEDVSPFFSLIDPFKISYVNTYTLDYYMQHRKEPATNDYKIEIRNQNKDRHSNFLLSTEHLNLLQKVVGNITGETAIKIPDKYDEERPKAPPFEYPEMISTFEVKIYRLRINLIKLIQGMKLAEISLSKFILKQRAQNNISQLGARATLEIQYFNRRKMFLEPFLEPWCFLVVQITRPEENQIILCNWKSADFDPKVELEEKFLNRNALNLNVSVAALESILELFQLFSGQISQAKPYRIINQTGFKILITSSLIPNSMNKHRIEDGNSKALGLKFFKKSKKRHVTESNTRALIDLQILDSDKGFKKIAALDEPKSTMIKRTDDGDEYYKGGKKYSELQTLKAIDDHDDVFLPEYKSIKKIDCDLIGKKYYRLRGIKDTNANLNNIPSNKRHFDFLFGAKRVIENESILLLSSVHLNPEDGAKEVILRSTTIIRNNLDIELVMTLAAPRIQEVKKTIGRGSKYYIPIELLNPETKFSFKFEESENNDASETYGLMDILRSKKLGKDDYSDEEDGIASEDEYKDSAGNDKCYRQKRDMIISFKDGEKKFTFVLSVIKKKIPLNLVQGGQDDEEMVENFIVLNPIVSFTNATVRPVKLKLRSDEGINNSRPSETNFLEPGKTVQMYDIEFNPDLCLAFNMNNYIDTASRKLFRKSEKKERFCLEFKPAPDKNKKSLLYLWAENKYVSTFSRSITLYCPYLIINETSENLKYQEVGLTQNILSEDIALIVNEENRSQLRRARTIMSHQEDEGEYIEPEKPSPIYDRIHMFSTSKKMNKLQISLQDSKSWSKPFSLETADGVVYLVESIKDFKNNPVKRPNVYVNVTNAFNQVARILKDRKRDAHKKRKKFEFSVRTQSAPEPFHRSKLIIFTPRFAIKNETDQLIMIAQHDYPVISEENAVKISPNSWEYFHWPDSRKPPYVVMARVDPNGKTIIWSGRFKIDQVDEFTVKLLKDKNKAIRSYQDEFYFSRVVISIDGTTVCVRITQEDPENPPYRIVNNTKYDIYFKQKPPTDKNEKLRFLDSERCKLESDKTAIFTWDDFVLNKLLEVEIEGKVNFFKIDDMGYHNPIELSNSDSYVNEKGGALLKKGYLKRKKPYDDDYTEEYCVLSIPRRRLKMYSKNPSGEKTVIDLKSAKIEDQKDRDFVLNVEIGKRSELFTFRAKTENDARKWIEFIKKAAFIGNLNNTIHVKVDPVNSTKVVTFYLAKNEMPEEGVLDENKPKNPAYVYKVNISNIIGISIMDNTPRELLSITVKNTLLNFSIMDDYNQGPERSNDIQWDRKSIFFSIDSVAINNQLHDAQFPVILARNRKITSTNMMPFICLNYLSKTPKNSVESTLNYITQFDFFVDTFEIRIDDVIIDAIFNMYMQIPFVSGKLDDSSEKLIYDPQPLDQKLEKKIRDHINEIKRIYVKHITLEPIDICFTFRSAPGHKFGAMAAGFLTDFGLVLASIDSAKIRLNCFQSTHMFGSQVDLITRISKHYSRQIWNQLYKLFGSIELLGNPVSLISNIGTGVVELFYEPFYALVTGKQTKHGNFGTTLAHGAVSFISHSVSGISSTIYNITKTIMKGLATLTADPEYLRKRHRIKNRRIKSIKEGVVFGLGYWAKTIFSAFTGIFTEPCYHGKTGVGGFIKGIYIAVVSTFIKPVVATYDSAIMLIQGVKNSAKYEEHAMDIRTRPPRIFGNNHEIIEYDWSIAAGDDTIRRLKKKKTEEHERIMFYDEIEIQSRRKKKIIYQVIFTDMRFLFVRKYNNLDFTKIKLYKIENLTWNAKKKSIEFKLLVPIKKKKNKIILPYQDEDKAQKLIDEFHRLERKDDNSKENENLGMDMQNSGLDDM